jgi:hypothetical protein
MSFFCSPPEYYVALVPGGNHAAAGFRLGTGGGVQEYPHTPYILLDAEPERLETTLLHETGHVVMNILAGGRRLDGLEIASIPHRTAALTDRTTAFSAGCAIHLYGPDYLRENRYIHAVTAGPGDRVHALWTPRPPGYAAITTRLACAWILPGRTATPSTPRASAGTNRCWPIRACSMRSLPGARRGRRADPAGRAWRRPEGLLHDC